MQAYWTHVTGTHSTISTHSTIGRMLQQPARLIAWPLAPSPYLKSLCLMSFCLRSICLVLIASATARATPPETLLHTFNAYADGAAPNSVFAGRDGNYYGTTAWGGAYGYGTVYKVTPSTGAVTTLHTFNVSDGAGPNTGLIQASDGYLYGMTFTSAPLGPDGPTGPSLLYKLSTDGSTYKILRTFAVPGYGGVVQGAVGAAVTLFGTTSGGGTQGYGTVFTITGDGTLFKVLHNFASIADDGVYPGAAPIQGRDGYLYGTAGGGLFGSGTVFKINTLGTTYTLLHSFNGSDGQGPYTAPLIQGPNGTLYGTTPEGGENDDGVVFQVNPDGSAFGVVHSFSGTDGATPYAGLAQSGNGVYFGATFYGGAFDGGTTFQFTSAKDFQTLHQFNGEIEGKGPNCVIEGSDNAVHATAWWGASTNAGTLFTTKWGSSAITTVGVFGNDYTDGANPGLGRPVIDRAGNGYGTTRSGGDTGQGTLYRLSANGEYTILHSFAAGLEGADPTSMPILDNQGNLYGTTYDGGAANAGTIWSYSTVTDTFTTLHTFGVTDTINHPIGGLTLVGNILYGTSSIGGARGCGAVYRFTLPTPTAPAQVAVLYSFSGKDGSAPADRLLLGADNNLYGTTVYGGAGYSSGETGYGTIFKLTPQGRLTSLRLLQQGDGINPVGGLIQGRNGLLYGTTSQGSINNLGSVYTIDPDGSGFNVLHAFNGSDGASPVCDLMQGTDGLLYGTTLSVTGGFGTVFQISVDGHLFNTLHLFAGQNMDGANPGAGVTEAADGNLYGTTYGGGIGFTAQSTVGGCIYQLKTQLPLIANYSPGSGKVGQIITVQGANLAGASVTINGVAQTVLSDTATMLTFRVTTGTTGGPIIIATPNGTVASSNSFTVLP